MSTRKKKASWWQITKGTAMAFAEDNAMKLSASLSYYTVFAIGPLLLMIITLTGLFVSRETVTEVLSGQIQSLLGASAATQIVDIITNLQAQQSSAAMFGIIGAITLFMGATGVFLEIQDSINYIWCIKAKPKKGWLKFIVNRMISFSLIIGLGFLLIVSLLINTLTDLLMSRLEYLLGGSQTVLLQILNFAILFGIITLLFGIIYKVLPDAVIRWKDAFIGAAFTGILFLIGKFAIGLYLGNSAISSTYGTAASVIFILLWVYYSAVILYFGAEFTKVYALTRGGGIEPNDTAVLIEKVEVKEVKGANFTGDLKVNVTHGKQQKTHTLPENEEVKTQAT